RALIANLAVSFQGLANNASQFRREIWVKPQWWGRLFVQNGIKDGGRRVSQKGQCPGGHLVEHCAERKNVSSGIEVFAQRLLGRHVGDGAEGAARTGEVEIITTGDGGTVRSHWPMGFG